MGEYLAELKRAAPTAAEEVEEGLRKGARVELHSLKKAEHNGKKGELLEYDAVAGRWGVKLSLKERLRVQPANLTVMSGGDEYLPILPQLERATGASLPDAHGGAVKLCMTAICESTDGHGKSTEKALRKMALYDTTAIPLELLSSPEQQSVMQLTQHALVTKDE